MRKVTIILFTVFTCFFSPWLKNNTVAQIYLPGDHNDWILDGDNQTTLKANLGATDYYGITISPSPNDEFKIAGDSWSPQWANSNTITNYDLQRTIQANGGNAIWQGSPAAYVHVCIKNPSGYVDADLPVGIMGLSAEPIGVTASQVGFNDGGTFKASTDPQIVTITTTAAKCAEENIYLRYTTNNWTSSNFVLAQVSGSEYTAEIPGQAPGTNVSYYALTTTLTWANGNDLDTEPDLMTINYDTNSGANYNYEVPAAGANTVKKVVLQGFWWDYWNENYPNSWANYLTELAPRLRGMGIDAVWIPPAYKNTGTNSVGYSPFDHYDLGDKFQKNSVTTRFGTKDEYLRMVAVMHANGIEVIQDIVLNHVDGAGASDGSGGVDPAASSNQWKNFRYVCYETRVPETGTENATEYLSRKGRWYKNHHNFHPHAGHNQENDDWTASHWGPDFCYGYFEDGTGNGYGQSSNAIYNPVQASGYNRTQARNWIMWLKKQTAVDGFRWDAVKHFPYFVAQDLSYNLKYSLPSWSKGNEAMFNVGEYVGGKSNLDGYVNNVTYSNGGNDELIGTFDFGLREAFYGIITGNGGYNLGNVPGMQQNERVHYYASTSSYVHRTVPFVNNHDTFRPEKDGDGNYIGWYTGDELAPHIDPFNDRLSVVYAIALAVDGNPQIFFEDLFNIGGTSKRYTHDPANTTDLPTRSALENLLWCHQNLDFKSGAYKVRWQDQDALVIERSTKALIAVNDNWTAWQNLTGVQTDFPDGTVLKDYSGANGTAQRTVYGGGKVNIDIPPCDGTANDGRRGYAVWAPIGISTNYTPPRNAETTQEWEMANDLGDSHRNSLRQGGELPDNSTVRRLAGKIFVANGSTVTYELDPADPTKDLTLSLWDMDGTRLDQVSGTGSLSDTYTATTTGWVAVKVRNTNNTYTGQKCWVRATYTAPQTVNTEAFDVKNMLAIWTGNKSTDWFDRDNWETGLIPDATCDVVIPTWVENAEPTITGDAACKNMTINSGRTVTVNAGATLAIKGNLINYGTLNIITTDNTESLTVTGNTTIESPGSITISGNGDVTLKSDLTINSPDGILTVSESADLIIGGSLNNNAGADKFIPGAGTVSFTGTNTGISGTTNFNNLEIKPTGSSVFTFNSNVTLNTGSFNGNNSSQLLDLDGTGLITAPEGSISGVNLDFNDANFPGLTQNQIVYGNVESSFPTSGGGEWQVSLTPPVPVSIEMVIMVFIAVFLLFVVLVFRNTKINQSNQQI